MREYQQNFSRIEEAKTAEATETIVSLKLQVNAWAAKHGGKWPATLLEVDPSLGLDPWRQEWLYAAPGKCNPATFDVWSRRGQSRIPGHMLGNWANPFVAPGHVVEGEAMLVSQLCARCSHEILDSEGHVRGAPISGGHYLQLNVSSDSGGDDHQRSANNISAILQFSTPKMVHTPLGVLIVSHNTKEHHALW